jgi:hypothetical protein
LAALRKYAGHKEPPMRLFLVLFFLPAIAYPARKETWEIYDAVDKAHARRAANVQQMNDANDRWTNAIDTYQRQKRDREILNEMRRQNDMQEQHLRYLCAQDPNCK